MLRRPGIPIKTESVREILQDKVTKKPIIKISNTDKIYQLLQKKPLTLIEIGIKVNLKHRALAYAIQELKLKGKIEKIPCKCCNVGTFFKAVDTSF